MIKFSESAPTPLPNFNYSSSTSNVLLWVEIPKVLIRIDLLKSKFFYIN